jgi:hypothetical protein
MLICTTTGVLFFSILCVCVCFIRECLCVLWFLNWVAMIVEESGTVHCYGVCVCTDGLGFFNKSPPPPFTLLPRRGSVSFVDVFCVGSVCAPSPPCVSVYCCMRVTEVHTQSSSSCFPKLVSSLISS